MAKKKTQKKQKQKKPQKTTLVTEYSDHMVQFKILGGTKLTLEYQERGVAQIKYQAIYH